jgi:hypothetical protein
MSSSFILYPWLKQAHNFAQTELRGVLLYTLMSWLTLPSSPPSGAEANAAEASFAF